MRSNVTTNLPLVYCLSALGAREFIKVKGVLGKWLILTGTKGYPNTMEGNMVQICENEFEICMKGCAQSDTLSGVLD